MLHRRVAWLHAMRGALHVASACRMVACYSQRVACCMQPIACCVHAMQRVAGCSSVLHVVRSVLHVVRMRRVACTGGRRGSRRRTNEAAMALGDRAAHRRRARPECYRRAHRSASTNPTECHSRPHPMRRRNCHSDDRIACGKALRGSRGTWPRAGALRAGYQHHGTQIGRMRHGVRQAQTQHGHKRTQNRTDVSSARRPRTRRAGQGEQPLDCSANRPSIPRPLQLRHV
jgi:hypothetical protein